MLFLETELGLFLTGFLGGIAADLLLVYRSRVDFIGVGVSGFLRRGGDNFGYIVVTFLMSALGGAVVILYVAPGAKLVPILAFQIGASTPLIITKFVAATPDPMRTDA